MGQPGSTRCLSSAALQLWLHLLPLFFAPPTPQGHINNLLKKGNAVTPIKLHFHVHLPSPLPKTSTSPSWEGARAALAGGSDATITSCRHSQSCHSEQALWRLCQHPPAMSLCLSAHTGRPWLVLRCCIFILLSCWLKLSTSPGQYINCNKHCLSLFFNKWNFYSFVLRECKIVNSLSWALLLAKGPPTISWSFKQSHLSQLMSTSRNLSECSSISSSEGCFWESFGGRRAHSNRPASLWAGALEFTWERAAISLGAESLETRLGHCWLPRPELQAWCTQWGLDKWGDPPCHGWQHGARNRSVKETRQTGRNLNSNSKPYTGPGSGL
jgi:hypothetical protein